MQRIRTFPLPQKFKLFKLFAGFIPFSEAWRQTFLPSFKEVPGRLVLACGGVGSPVEATRKVLKKAGWTHEDVDLMEINEAFAAQALSVNKEMGWDTSKINVNGGAIALGHPIGASGARVLVTLLHEMIRRDAKRGVEIYLLVNQFWKLEWR